MNSNTLPQSSAQLIFADPFMERDYRAKQRGLRLLSDIPNQVGFALTVYSKVAGPGIRAVVAKDSNGLHYLTQADNGQRFNFGTLAGWEKVKGGA